jgi:hypothetical protein
MWRYWLDSHNSGRSPVVRTNPKWSVADALVLLSLLDLVSWTVQNGYVSIKHLCGLVVIVPRYRSKGPGFDSQRYQSFWEVVGLERGPLSLLSTIEKLLGTKSSGSGLESLYYGHGDPLCWQRDTHYLQKLALTSLTSGDLLVGMVRSKTEATEFSLVYVSIIRCKYGEAVIHLGPRFRIIFSNT